MNKAKKYLKDENNLFEIVDGITDQVCAIDDFEYTRELIKREILTWFTKPTERPKLTLDEKIILRNIDKNIYSKIGFDLNGLYLIEKETGKKDRNFEAIFGREGFFSFIEDGEEYEIQYLLGGKIDAKKGN